MRYGFRAVGAAAAAVAVSAAFVFGVPNGAVADVSADGRIVYVVATPNGSDIHLMNADGTGDVNLTPDPDPTDEWNPLDLDPAWSPDGTRIAFISNRVTETNPDGNLEVFVMNADGSDVAQVTFANPPNTWEFWQSYDPDWSPDGTQIVFSGYRTSGASELFVVPVNGSGAEVQITSSADFANKWEPQWSPDGSTILFTWGWDEYSQDLRTINPDGTNEVNLFPDTVMTSERNPDWSPDGTRIAFRADHDPRGIDFLSNVDVYVMEYPSRVFTRVTDDPTVDEAPAWSPDGSQITFTSLRGGTYDLYVVDAPPVPAPASSLRTASYSTTSTTTDGAVPLTSAATDEQDPAWTGPGDVVVDTVPPRSVLRAPQNGNTYPRADLIRVTGAAIDDQTVTRVEVALRRNHSDGSKSWWDGSAWVRGRTPLWQSATGATAWEYKLPALSPTTAASAKVASYTVISRAVDAAGNVETVLKVGRNQATFEVAP